MTQLDIGIVLSLYLLPSFVALVRKHHNPGPLIVVNVLLGWTLLGWVAALAMAFSNPPKPAEPAARYDVYTGERLTR
jgi:hypothetical protein